MRKKFGGEFRLILKTDGKRLTFCVIKICQSNDQSRRIQELGIWKMNKKKTNTHKK